jgi:signal transduction histidine kinase
MIPPKIPENENDRLLAVEKYKLLDTLPEELYDNITALIANICDTPISLVTLMDRERNFLKSHHGVELSESPRSISFCGHTITSNEDILIVEDARKDIRFSDNPLVTEYSAIFYAGVSLIDPAGYKIGTLCVYDNKPRKLTEGQQEALKMMARQVMALMIKHRENIDLSETRAQLIKKNSALTKFSHVVSHDLKSPLNKILSLTELIKIEDGDTLSQNSHIYLDLLQKSSNVLKSYIDGMLTYYNHDQLLDEDWTDVAVDDYFSNLVKLIQPAKDCKLTYSSTLESLRVNEPALTHVLMNLVTNSFKYNSKDVCHTHVEINDKDGFYVFSIKDNGDGINPDFLPEIFDLFTVGTDKDRYGQHGTGIGLASVQRIVEAMEGEISVRSALGEGSEFTFTLRKRSLL